MVTAGTSVEMMQDILDLAVGGSGAEDGDGATTPGGESPDDELLLASGAVDGSGAGGGLDVDLACEVYGGCAVDGDHVVMGGDYS